MIRGKNTGFSQTLSYLWPQYAGYHFPPQKKKNKNKKSILAFILEWEVTLEEMIKAAVLLPSADKIYQALIYVV